MGNLESHLVTIAVAPEGSGSHVTWSVEVVPDDLLPTLPADLREARSSS